MKAIIKTVIRTVIKTAVLFAGTLGFWGFVYPELCIPDSAYEIEYGEEAQDRPDIYEFLNGTGKVRIKFKTAEYLYQIKETVTKKDEKND